MFICASFLYITLFNQSRLMVNTNPQQFTDLFGTNICTILLKIKAQRHRHTQITKEVVDLPGKCAPY